MVANSIDTLEAYTPNRNNILKAKRAAVFVAPMTAAVPTSLTSGTSGSAPTLSELTDFEPIGLINKDDAISRTRDRDVSDIMAVGYQDPVRSDVTNDTFTAEIVCLETRKSTIEKYLQVDLSGVTPDANTGEISFPQPNDGLLPQYRWLFVCQDGIGANRTWWGWCFTAGIVSEVDDQNAGGEDDGWYWPMTIASQTDTTLGYSVRHYFAGAGWKASLEDRGWTVA